MSDDSMFETFDEEDIDLNVIDGSDDSDTQPNSQNVDTPIDISGFEEVTSQPENYNPSKMSSTDNNSQSNSKTEDNNEQTNEFSTENIETDKKTAQNTSNVINNENTSAVDNEQDNYNTEDNGKNEQSFVSFDEARKRRGGSNGKKPPHLNKNLITIIIGIVIASVLLLLMWRPDIKRKEKESVTSKPEAKELFYDLESRANNEKIEKSLPENPKPIPEEKTETEPAVNEKYINKEDPIDPYTMGKELGRNNNTSSTVSTTTLSIPDTRNDSLQAKTINGIKGITSTQNTYLTDYETQKFSNSVAAATNGNNGGNGLGAIGSPDAAVERLLASAQTGNNYNVQNAQDNKNSFFKSGAGGGNGTWLGVNTIWQGTIFEATLTSEINTDLPGEVTARVAKNIYSSQDGRYLLIPQNSILLGTYNSNISYNQRRAQVIWTTLIRPDGYQISLGGMNATDAKGASGLKGIINDHPGAYLKAVFLMSVLNIVNAEYQNTIDQQNTNEYVKNVAANAQDVTNTLAGKLIDRAMDIQPTLKIKSGTKINIVVNQNLTIPVCENIPVTQKYEKGKLPREISK